MGSLNYKEYFDKAVSYEKYKENFQTEIASGEQHEFSEYLPHNWSRSSRLDKKFNLSEELKTVVSTLKQPLYWMVITEHWCGDASQINPIITKVAESSKGMIKLKYIYRDENPDLINAHLTDGKSRSIPILIQMDENFKLLNTYGPRPAEAQKLVMEILAKGENYIMPVHTWYARDKQKSIQADLVEFLTN